MNVLPFLSIVIVNWNGEKRLRECLAALEVDLRAGEHGDVEIVVVDNASEDASCAVVAEVMPEAILVEEDANRGFAGGANSGIARASGTWVATLNNDVRVESGWIAAMRRAAVAAPPECGMLQPCMLRDDGSQRIDTTGVAMRRGGGIEDRDRDRRPSAASAAGEVFCASAGAAWYRRRMLGEVASEGWVFGPDYFMYLEDVDLGWRGRLAGWTAEYVPDAVVYHERHGSAGPHGKGFVKRQCTRNRIRTWLGNGSARCVALAMPRLARDMAWLLLDAGPSALVEIARALRDGLSARRALSPAARAARAGVEAAWFDGR